MQGSWDAVTSFEESEHPADISASMQPIMQNIQAGPSKGGNELIDVDALTDPYWSTGGGPWEATSSQTNMMWTDTNSVNARS